MIIPEVQHIVHRHPRPVDFGPQPLEGHGLQLRVRPHDRLGQRADHPVLQRGPKGAVPPGLHVVRPAAVAPAAVVVGVVPAPVVAGAAAVPLLGWAGWDWSGRWVGGRTYMRRRASRAYTVYTRQAGKQACTTYIQTYMYVYSLLQSTDGTQAGTHCVLDLLAAHLLLHAVQHLLARLLQLLLLLHIVGVTHTHGSARRPLPIAEGTGGERNTPTNTRTCCACCPSTPAPAPAAAAAAPGPMPALPPHGVSGPHILPAPGPCSGTSTIRLQCCCCSLLPSPRVGGRRSFWKLRPAVRQGVESSPRVQAAGTLCHNMWRGLEDVLSGRQGSLFGVYCRHSIESIAQQLRRPLLAVAVVAYGQPAPTSPSAASHQRTDCLIQSSCDRDRSIQGRMAWA